MKSVIDKSVWENWRQFEKNENAPGFFRELLERVLVSAPKLMDDLHGAIEERNLKVIHYCSHTLSSSCKALGAMELSALLKEMELATRAQTPVVREDLAAPMKSWFHSFIEEVQTEYDSLKKAS